jgi:chemosensory pili system protein ChpA (sensor histidine kinase/response regulator)
LLINSGVEEVALTVDAIIGSQDIVVKTLGDHLQKVRGIIGATINGDGSVVPILEMSELAARTQAEFLTRFESNHQRPTEIHRKLAMVVDDSISVRRVTENLLTSAGWDVVTAIDGVDALEKLADLETAPDVFLSDMEMPRMDGLELVRQIREQPEFEMTPIIMVTSRASEKHRQKAFEAGTTEYVVKPYNDESLMEMIRELVQTADCSAIG